MLEFFVIMPFAAMLAPFGILSNNNQFKLIVLICMIPLAILQIGCLIYWIIHN